jgi:dTDP-4-dehydrorhamnose reductase
VIHCAAASEVDRCELDPAWAWRLNREMALNVAAAARKAGARLAHISTDAVFDGAAGYYRESDEARPITIYGESKLAGERAVQDAYPEALVLRINLFGWSPGPKRSLAEWFLSRLEAEETCPGFTDVFFSPLLAPHLGRAILDLLAAGASGVFHLPGQTCLTKYEFGVRLATEFGLDPDRIRPTSVDEAKLAARRPKQLCLNGEKAEAVLGRQLPGIESGLRELRETRGRLPFVRVARVGTAA